VEDLDGTPVYSLVSGPDRALALATKRAVDLVLAAIGLVVLSPLLLLVAWRVRRADGGPALFRQSRVGLHGRPFQIVKFRTMQVGAEARVAELAAANEIEGHAFKVTDDPRITPIGRRLRRWSLDELPQLWNVLMGDMSLVGPRPEQPRFVEEFRGSIPRYMLRHHVKAGMTGWAQVNGLRGDTPLEDRIRYDLYYLQNWSLWFDVRILFLTVARVFKDASAY
jgi:exopolysaccharide biosynthesis polyprenyl glycosylphosphotransferase